MVEEHLLVVAAQEDRVGELALHLEQDAYAFARLGSAVDVVAEEYQPVGDVGVEVTQHQLEFRGAAVDVADAE